MDEENENFSNADEKFSKSEKIHSDGEENEENLIEAEIIDAVDDYSGKNKKTVKINKTLKKFLIGTIIILTLLLVASVGGFIYFLQNPELKNYFSKFNLFKINNSLIGQNPKDTANESKTIIKYEEKSEDEREYIAETVYEIISPAVVGVVVYDLKSDIIAGPLGQASGLVISEDGYIVTNAHVVGKSQDYNIKIVLDSENEVQGKIIGIDTRTDLAVIKIEKTGLKFATFGNSDAIKIGSWTIAIGNPLGMNFARSLTRGVVSAVNRNFGLEKSFVKYIQTDAAINPGNSGGPLVNMYGQVIGITNIKVAFDGCEGMGFAIPSNTVKSIVEEIIRYGYVTGRAKLGISVKTVSYYQSRIYNVPVGALISVILKESDLNLKAEIGDIIVKFDDKTITKNEDLYAELNNHKAGDVVELEIFRRSSMNQNSPKQFKISVKLLEDKEGTSQ